MAHQKPHRESTHASDRGRYQLCALASSPSGRSQRADIRLDGAGMRRRPEVIVEASHRQICSCRASRVSRYPRSNSIHMSSAALQEISLCWRTNSVRKQRRSFLTTNSTSGTGTYSVLAGWSRPASVRLVRTTNGPLPPPGSKYRGRPYGCCDANWPPLNGQCPAGPGGKKLHRQIRQI